MNGSKLIDTNLAKPLFLIFWNYLKNGNFLFLIICKSSKNVTGLWIYIGDNAHRRGTILLSKKDSLRRYSRLHVFERTGLENAPVSLS